FRSNLPRGVLRLRLEGFRQRWGGTLLHNDDGNFTFSIRTPRSFWQRWLRRRPGLEIHIQLDAAAAQGLDAVDVMVRVQPRSLSRAQSSEALEVIGLLLLENLRNHLQLTPRRRGQDRLPWDHPFPAQPIFADGRLGPSIACRGNDLSFSGIGFLAPCELPTPQFHLHLPQTPQTPAVAVAARVVRSRRRED